MRLSSFQKRVVVAEPNDFRRRLRRVSLSAQLVSRRRGTVGAGKSCEPYTNKALTTVWLFILVVFALSASGAVTRPWVLLLVAAAFGAPLILTLWPKPRYDGSPDGAPMVGR